MLFKTRLVNPCTAFAFFFADIYVKRSASRANNTKLMDSIIFLILVTMKTRGQSGLGKESVNIATPSSLSFALS